MLVLEGNNPRFPWEPSTTMLTYGLTGTTEDSGLTAANNTQCPPRPAPQASRSHPQIFAHPGAPSRALRC